MFSNYTLVVSLLVIILCFCNGLIVHKQTRYSTRSELRQNIIVRRNSYSRRNSYDNKRSSSLFISNPKTTNQENNEELPLVSSSIASGSTITDGSNTSINSDYINSNESNSYGNNDINSNSIESNSNGNNGNSKVISGLALLNGVAVLWGTQHVVIKTALMDYPTASVLNFWRFALSALLFSPSLINIVRTKNISTVRAGAELGIYTFLGFAFQAVGLLTTTASKSAFLLYLNVKFVPFLAALLFKKQISNVTWLSAFLALSGTCLLSTDNGPFNIGDAWCVAAAVASAFFILRLEKLSNNNNAAELNSISFLSVALLCSIWMGVDLFTGKLGVPSAVVGDVVTNSNTIFNTILQPILNHPEPVLYLGLVTTGLCNYLQTIGQRTVPAEKAAIIYSIDPVYGAIFSRLLLGEEFGGQGYIGAGLIMTAIFISNKFNNSNKTSDEV